MGFLSFNEKYYLEKLNRYENRPLTFEEIYEVKQLLKVLDDILDEGYTGLNRYLEEKHCCVSRLRKILEAHHEKPFDLPEHRLSGGGYTDREWELRALMEEMISKAGAWENCADHPFLRDIRGYCDWMEYDQETAYVFLFRDALLPYVYFASRGRQHLYPWLISRRFIEQITSEQGVDDDIRLPIYEALEENIAEYESFRLYCGKRICSVLNGRPKLKTALLELLGSIREKRIMVVESGYCGTIPMLLAALDDRVDFRMFTTAPFLYEVYRDKIYRKQYEKIRMFETLYSQDMLIQYAGFRDGRFYVRRAEDQSVTERALSEMRLFVAKSM